jgi:tetratricopeptide (TPR) repeat protein
MVVVDTGSTDGTIDIAKRCGATVIPYEWHDDFSAARNESLNHATGEWVLYLDADERLAPGQHGLIRSLLHHPEVGAYLFTIEGDHHLPSGVVHQVNAYPRLFRRLPSVRFEGKVHEQITPSILRTGIKIISSSVIIHHLGYAESIDAIRKKCERNIQLLRRQLRDEPRNGYLRYQIGNTLTILEQYEAARQELERALREKNLPPGIHASLLNLLAEIDLREDKPTEALQRSTASLHLVPSQVLARWLLTVAELSLGAFADALKHLEEIVELQRTVSNRVSESVAHDVLIDGARLNFQRAVCYEGLGQDDRALHHYMRSYEQQPQIAGCRDRINQLIPRLREIPAALSFAENYPEFLYLVLRRGIELSVPAGRYTEAVGYLDRLGQLHGVTTPDGFAERLRALWTKVSQSQSAQ